ncbi:MAG: hypothetical protein JWO00_208 [Candidatus Parcubacteria bacterium]|nr:hypothetical protein [Candidatus Parcubacteria bacterium]
MKRQIVTIHGGDVHNNEVSYLRALRAWTIEKDELVSNPTMQGWKSNLHAALGEGYEVLSPEMPNWMNAKYAEWKIWFEKLFKFLDNGPIFIGHSLGGIFLARYFAENADKKKITALFLVAAPYRDRDSKDQLADFVLPKDLSRLEKLGDKVHLYASEDDPVVSFSSFKKYAKLLPQARTTVFKNKGHFRMAEFPEIVKDINAAFAERQ